MKSLSILVLGLVVFCSMGAGPCWIKHYPQAPVVYPIVVNPAPVIVAAPVYAPVVVQERVYVPVIQQRVEYRPVVGQFFMNYGHYYNVPLYYNNHNYYYNGWSGYSY